MDPLHLCRFYLIPIRLAAEQNIFQEPALRKRVPPMCSMMTRPSCAPTAGQIIPRRSIRALFSQSSCCRFMFGVRNQFTFHTGANLICSIPNQAPVILGGHPAFMTTVLKRASEIADHVVWHPAMFIRSYSLSAGGVIYPALCHYLGSAWLQLLESPFASRLWRIITHLYLSLQWFNL